jgi:hypothetical protein
MLKTNAGQEPIPPYWQSASSMDLPVATLLQRPDQPTEVAVYPFELSIDIKPMMLDFSS